MIRFSYRRLAANALAAGLLGAVTSLNACGTVDCNDTATCPPPAGADAFVGPGTTVEASDELLSMTEASADASDSGTDTIDMSADGSDSPAVLGDVTADMSDATDGADVTVVRDSPDELPLVDRGIDVGMDVGMDVRVDVGRDVGIDMGIVSQKCTSNVLTTTNAIALSVNNANVASGAVDGNLTTRWESAQGIDPQWIYVDFGSPVFINRVRIIWETACGKNYDLQTSNDATAWTTMKSISGNTLSNFGAPTDWSMAADHTGFTGVGRYLRVYGTARCTTNYGYSIWEMQVYGDPNPACKP